MALASKEIDALLDETLSSQDIDTLLDDVLAEPELSDASLHAQQGTRPAEPQKILAESPKSLIPKEAIPPVEPLIPVEELPGPIDVLQQAFSRVVPKYQEEVAAAQQRLDKPESNAIDKILGSLQYVASPITALTGALVGEPVTSGLESLGVPDAPARIAGTVSELLVPLGGGISSVKAKKVSDVLKNAYGINTLDPAINAEAASRLKIQKQQLSSWEKYIGPKFDTVSDKIGGALKRIGIAENLTPQQQVIKQFKIKKREAKGEISNRFYDLAQRAEALPLEEKELFSRNLSSPNVPSGNSNVDSLVSEIHGEINKLTRGVNITKEQKTKIALKSAKGEIPLYHGSTLDIEGDLFKSSAGDFGPAIYFATDPSQVHLRGPELFDVSDDAPKIIPAYFKGKVIDSDGPELYDIAKKYGFRLPKEADAMTYPKFISGVLEKFKPTTFSEQELANSGQQIANNILINEGIDAIKGVYPIGEQYGILNPQAIRYTDNPIFDTRLDNVATDLADEIPGLLGARGITKTIEKDEYELYKEYGFKLTSTKPGAKEIRIKRNFSKEELGQLNELDDIGNYIANIGKSLSNDVSSFQFYDDVSKRFADKISLTKAPGYKKITGRKIRGTDLFQKGVLADKYAPEELVDDLEMFEKVRVGYENIPGIKQYLSANRVWKIAKTAYNPKVIFGNYVSALLTYDLLDAKKRALVTASKEIKNKGSLYDLAKKHAVFQSGFVRTEKAGFSNEALDAYVNTIRKPADISDNKFIQTGIDLANNAVKAGVKTNTKILEFYNFGDDFFRFGVFIDRLEKGFSPIDAAVDARKYLIDYDINAPVVNVLRDFTHPFISYPYRVLPILAESATKHPVKFGKWVALGYGLQQALDEDETQAVDLLQPRQKQPLFGVPGLPSPLVKIGEDKVINASRVVPGGNLFGVPEMGIPMVPQSLQPSFGLAGAVNKSFIKGEDQFGEPLLESQTSDLSKLGTRAEAFLQGNVPNIPGVPYAPSTNQLKQAISGKYSSYQDPKSILDATLSSIGIDIINLDKGRLAKVQQKNLSESIKVISQREYKNNQDFQKGLLSEEEFKLNQLKFINEKLLLKTEYRSKIK